MVKTKELFGERVRRLRKQVGWTQNILAERSNLSIQMIKDIESNKSPGGIKSFLGLSRAFHISIEELIGEEEINNKVEVKDLPASKIFKRALLVPDRVYELAADINDSGHDIWDIVIPQLQVAADKERSQKSSQRA